MKNPFKRGDEVIIVSLFNTDKSFGSNPSMLDMADGIRVFKVDSADHTSVMINGYYFNPNDLRPKIYKEETFIEPKIFHFDVKNLEL